MWINVLIISLSVILVVGVTIKGIINAKKGKTCCTGNCSACSKCKKSK